MKIIIFIIYLLCSISCQGTNIFAPQDTVLLASSQLNTVLIPSGIVVIEQIHTGIGNPVGNGSQWLWTQGGNSWPDGMTLTFRSSFQNRCARPATLKIAADNIFQATLNGGPSVMSGVGWAQSSSFTLPSLACGLNNITTIVTNLHNGTSAAFVLLVTQDQKNCFRCPQNYYYDDRICKCKCSKQCKPGFHLNKLCVCIKDCPFVKACKPWETWNQQTCKCQCVRKVCLPKAKWDSNSCQCV